MPFHAHEVLEATWKAAPDAERDLWQGLAQLAVGLTHALRGNSSGAATLLRRGADRVAGYVDEPPYGIDVAGLLEWARSLAAQLSDGSPDVVELGAPRLCRT
jgi:predicted metal-dependent hydrolase